MPFSVALIITCIAMNGRTISEKLIRTRTIECVGFVGIFVVEFAWNN